MTKEIYISSTPHETRLAVVEDDQLAEIYYERENEYTLAGSVYKGKVTRVLPGMQSAFVDIGLERDAFLYVTDFAEESEDGEEYVALTAGPTSSRHTAPSSSNGHAAESQPRNAEHPQGANDPRREEASAPVMRPTSSENPVNDQATDETGAGSKRWRGRRGRRRGRNNSGPSYTAPARPIENGPGAGDEGGHDGSSAPAEAGTYQPAAEDFHDAEYALEHREDRPAESATQSTRPTPVAAPQASAMVLPGESLSKYRSGPSSGQPAAHAPYAAATAHAPAPVSTYQPPTMITGPLAWDGSDVLPGESLSRYRNKQREDEKPAASLPPEDLTGTASMSEQESASLHGPAAASPQFPQSEGTQPEAAVHDEKGTAAESVQAAPQDVSTQEQVTEYEPVEGSASYRFDPNTSTAYRQNFGPEFALEEPAAAHPSLEESYPVIASQPAEENAPGTPVGGPHIAAETQIAEPFFGESVSIATHHHVPAIEHQEIEVLPADHFDREDTQELDTLETENAETAFHRDGPDAPTLHAFDPGLGDLEEEVIDEEEAEAIAAHALAEEAEYDDLVEETMDVQMDNGLLSELVRDRHIEQRTRYVEQPEGDAGPDEMMIEEDAGDEGAFDGPAALEFESVPDSSSDEDLDGPAAARTDRRRPQRSQGRGMRGQQRSAQRGDHGRMRRGTAQTSNLPAITELLKPNQEILVQIAKEPIARKGARITSHIALPGRFLVFMPTVNHVGVSRKISSDEERQRLKRILLSEKGAASGGFIVRTAAATASEEDLRADIRFLLTLWAEMRQRAEGSKPPALIYHDLSLVERVLRDQVTDNFSAIWVDSEADYERVLRFLNRFEPALVRRVKLYTKETPLFEQFGIQEEINKALRSKVWLKSGGSIVINQTEALVAIDINTGKYVGKTARLEDTIVKTNLDAIPEIVRQIRLRDLGGIIVIDFIDMDERKNRTKVMQALEEELKHDRAPSKVLQFNDFGLVAITRKRVKQSLERTLSVPCSICTGTGMVKGPLTVCNEIYIELRKMHRQFDRTDVMLRVHPEVVKQLKASNGRWLSEMEEMSGKTIIVKSDAALHPEQFDIH
jgi:ribonuclease G